MLNQNFWNHILPLLTDAGGIRAKEEYIRDAFLGDMEKFDPKQLRWAVGVIGFEDGSYGINVSLVYIPTSVSGKKSARYRFAPKVTTCYLYTPEGEKLTTPPEYFHSVTVLSFKLKGYPVCCGLKMFYDFHYNDTVKRWDQRDFNQVIKSLLQGFHLAYSSLVASRLEAVFVHGRLIETPKDRTQPEVEIPKDATFNYGKFRTFFMENAAKIQSHSFFNYNSQNTLEKCEALFDKSWFPSRY